MNIFLRKIRELATEPKGFFTSAKNLYATKEVRPAFTSQQADEWYKIDPVVRTAINTLAAMTVGAGYYTSVPQPNDPQQKQAKDICDKFAETNNLDDFLERVALELYKSGNAYAEVISPQALEAVKLLPTAEISAVLDKKGTVEGYVQKHSGLKIDFTLEEIIHFRWGEVGTSIFGTGRIESITQLLDVKAKAVSRMDKILARYAAPKTFYFTRSEPEAKRLKDMLDHLSDDEDPIIQGEVKKETLEINPSVRFQFFYDFLEREIFEGLNAPLLSWIRNATEASAKVMLEAVEIEKRGIQRYLKRIVEARIFKPLVEQQIGEGVTVPNLNWGMAQPLSEVSLEELTSLADKFPSVITPPMVANILRKMGFPLETGEEVPPEEEEAIIQEAWEPIQVIYPMSDFHPGSFRIHTEGGRKIRVGRLKLGGRYAVQAILKPKGVTYLTVRDSFGHEYSVSRAARPRKSS